MHLISHFYLQEICSYLRYSGPNDFGKRENFVLECRNQICLLFKIRFFSPEFLVSMMFEISSHLKDYGELIFTL
jgi:hypothetical protein